jgi:hypothetical protein
MSRYITIGRSLSPPFLRDRQSHCAEGPDTGLRDPWRRGRESGADQSAEQPNPSCQENFFVSERHARGREQRLSGGEHDRAAIFSIFGKHRDVLAL